MTGKLIKFAIIPIFAGIGIYALLFKTIPRLIHDNNLGAQSAETPSPTPIPFRELTIPALRDKNYESKLGDLVKYTENSTYLTYLTDYQSDELQLDGLITVPKSNPPDGGWPAIVFVHGYIPPSEYKTTEKYTSYVDFLARNGFVVFKIDLRGHGNSEGDAGGAYYSPDYVIDTINAYKALQGVPFVNSKKIGFWGHSMGGNVTFRSLVVVKEIPAVVIWAGAVYSYSDMLKYGINDNSYRPPNQSSKSQELRLKLREQYGEFNSAHYFWKQIVPVNYLEGVKGAVQLHHAVDDNVVSINYSRDLIKTLEDSDIDRELYEYPSGGHNINNTSFNTAMQRTVEFYKQHLGVTD